MPEEVVALPQLGSLPLLLALVELVVAVMAALTALAEMVLTGLAAAVVVTGQRVALVQVVTVLL
jgi:hypothetical protein